MKIKRMNTWQKRSVFLIASTLLLTACVLVSVHNSYISNVTQAENKPRTVMYTGTIVKRDLNNLFETSNLVALCTITSEPVSFYVQRADSGKDILSDQFAKVDKVIMGTPYNDTVVIRIPGGTVGNRTEKYEENPVLEVGKQYLLFLSKPDMGGSYNTVGDYYYVQGLKQGVYKVTGNNEFVSLYGEKITADSLVIPSTVSRDGIYSVREEYLRNQEHNLKNGTITRERYEQAINIVDKYAIILSDTKVQ